MRIIGRFALCIVAALALSGFLCQRARADVLYSVTNLGPAGRPELRSEAVTVPTLRMAITSALSQSQQAAFQSGSFDIYAHPATAGNLPMYYPNGRHRRQPTSIPATPMST